MIGFQCRHDIVLASTGQCFTAELVTRLFACLIHLHSINVRLNLYRLVFSQLNCQLVVLVRRENIL